MANDASKQPGWRSAAASGPTAGKSDQGKRGWQKSATPEKAPISHEKKRRIKLFVALGALAVIGGSLAALVLWPKAPKTACLVLIGAGYETNMAVPHNAAGWKSLLDLHSLAEAGGGISMPWVKTKQLRLQLGPTNVKAQTEWDEEIWPKLLKTPAEATMILFLSMHGGGDENGAFLFADDPNLGKKIYVETIIDKLNDPKLNGKNKVLILDANHFAANWQAGMLFNDFARRLKQLKKKIEDTPNLVMICSSGDNQKSWVSPEWQRTIFSHYLIEGLKGAADRGGSENARVSAWELFEYAKDRVTAWVDVNRDRVQIPFLLGNESTAKAVEVAHVKEKYTEASYTKAPNFDAKIQQIKDNIDRHWSKWAQLQRNVPHPAVYSPHGWRHFQDMLVRYEELMRLGDPTNKAKELSASLSNLAKEIGQWREPIPNARSLANTLPMPSVLGKTPSWDAAALRRHYQQLFAASDDNKKWEEAWANLVAWYDGAAGADKSLQRPLFVLDFTKIALQTPVDANDVTVDSLKKTAALLKKFFDRQNVLAAGKLSRSTEGHFAIMLDRDHNIAANSPHAKLLLLALQVRLAAEEAAFALPRSIAKESAHPYSEVVWQWIKDKIENADTERRKGEDAIFGESDSHRNAADEHLKNALRDYQTALAEAAVLRSALKTCDEAASKLPYFARWAAGRTNLINKDQDEKKQRRSNQQRVGDIEIVSGDLDKLTSQLETKEFRGLEKLTMKVNDALGSLQTDFDIECKKLEDVHQHLEYHHIQNALSVPLLTNLKLRYDLVQTSSATSKKFHEDKIKGKKDVAAKAQELASLAKERGKNEGRMALATAGASKFGEYTLPQLTNQIATAALDGWQSSLSDVGREIGAHWQRSLNTIRAKWTDSIQRANLRDAATLLDPVEHMCRYITLGDAAKQIPTDTLGGSLPVDPVQGARRLRLHDMLLWQAERTWLDHWFMDSSDGMTTFYGPTCRAFLKDAEALAAGKSGMAKKNQDRKQFAVDQAKKYGRTVGLNVAAEGGATQHLVGDQSLTLHWKVAPSAEDLPPGTPVYWWNVTEKSKGTFKDIANQQPTARTRFLQREDKISRPITAIQTELQSVPLVPTQKLGNVNLRMLFRGQRLDVPVAVKVQDVADVITSRWPAPNKAQVAVFIKEGDPYGALCIALDFSGSMQYDLEGKLTKDAKKMRIQYVREAFAHALQSIPKGTEVSVLGFNSINKEYNPDWFRYSIPWEGDRDIKKLLAQFDDKAKRELPKWAGTPIARAMADAAEKGFPKEFGGKGPKILFVLTDGEDTFYKPTKINDTLKKTFGVLGCDIEANMICFAKKKSDGAKIAKQQFGMIETFGPPGYGVRGKFMVEPDPVKLSIAMDEALRPKFRLKEEKYILPNFEDGLIVRPTRDNRMFSPDIVLTDETRYDTYIPNVKDRNLKTAPGELLLLELFRGNGGFLSIRQPVFGRFIEKSKVGRRPTFAALARGAGEWGAAVLQHQHDSVSKLTQLLTIEKLPRLDATSPPDLRHIYPSIVWLEVQDDSGQPVQGLRWHQAHGYPAPSYRIHAGRLSSQKIPKLRAWFLGSDLPQRLGVPSLTTADLKAGTKKDVAGAAVQIVKSGKELRYVAVAPGVRSEQTCYVVQIAYDPKLPVMIQQEQAGMFRGEEHRYFTKAGIYTALFWSPKNARFDDATFRIVSIDRMKREAMFYEPDSLPIPAANYEPPDDFRRRNFTK